VGVGEAIEPVRDAKRAGLCVLDQIATGTCAIQGAGGPWRDGAGDFQVDRATMLGEAFELGRPIVRKLGGKTRQERRRQGNLRRQRWASR
jgi:hypothetical protein